MTDLRDQLALEGDLVIQGHTRYTKAVNAAEDQGRVASTLYGQLLLKNLVQPVSVGIKDFCNGDVKRRGKYSKLIKQMDAEVVAFIGLKVVLDVLHKGCTLTNICVMIGTKLEDELRFRSFKDSNPAYFNAVLRNFDRKNTTSYRHIRNVMTVTANRRHKAWFAWDKEVKVQTGAVVLEAVMQHTDICEPYIKKRPHYNITILQPTVEALDWIQKHTEYNALLHPYTKPCVIPPDNWKNAVVGGYLSEGMRKHSPLIKGLKQSVADFVAQHDLTKVCTAVSAVQATPWQVNTEVLTVMKTMWNNGTAVGIASKEPIDIPRFHTDIKPKEMDKELLLEFAAYKAKVSQLYTDEISRSSKAFETARVIAMAESYTDVDSFWFVHQCDFRGRVYASSSGINPQGAKYNKALLKFKNGMALGDKGMYWLSVHGANCYDIDKVSLEARVQWVNDNKAQIIASAEDPYSTVEWWSDNGQPYMFLAFCFEYAQAVLDPVNFISYLPIGMDGTCNGLQNFSALLRDPVGSAATNLADTDVPSDIYAEVAKKSLELLREAPPSDLKDKWLKFAEVYGGIPRSIAKRPVMTLPYGSTKYSCKGFIEDSLRELKDYTFLDTPEASSYFVEFLWEAIGSTVTAAKDTMSWLQALAKELSANDMPMWWVNPVGFPVYMDNRQSTKKLVSTVLFGAMKLTLREDTPKISSRKQVQGVAPNFVHSLDSAHMMLTVLNAQSQGIEDFAMIHDDFGTHAGNTEKFRSIIRESFVSMYTEYSPLQDVLDTCQCAGIEDLPAIPQSGSFDINNVLKSKYFFS